MRNRDMLENIHTPWTSLTYPSALPIRFKTSCEYNNELIHMCSQPSIDVNTLRSFMLKYRADLQWTHNNCAAWRAVLKSHNTLACQCFLETKQPHVQTNADLVCEFITSDRHTALFLLTLCYPDYQNTSVIPTGSTDLMEQIMVTSAGAGDSEIMKAVITSGSRAWLPYSFNTYAVIAIRAVWTLLDCGRFNLLEEWIGEYLRLEQLASNEMRHWEKWDSTTKFRNGRTERDRRFLEHGVILRAAQTHSFDVFDFVMDKLWARNVSASTLCPGYGSENVHEESTVQRYRNDFVQRVIDACFECCSALMLNRFLTSLDPRVCSPANTDVYAYLQEHSQVISALRKKPANTEVYAYLQEHSQVISALRKKRTRPDDDAPPAKRHGTVCLALN